MTISASATNFRSGEDINFEVTFENLSTEQHIITHRHPKILVFVVDSREYPKSERFGSPQQGVIESSEKIIVTGSLGRGLSRARHELVAIATFTLDTGVQVDVISNTIFLTVR